MTKPILLVKICYNIVCHSRSYNYFDKVTSWPQLIATFWSRLPICNVASDWPHTFLHLGVFV